MHAIAMAHHAKADLAALYEAYFVAERAWEKQLVARFGDDAAQARYEARGRGSFDCDLGRAYLALDKARRWYFGAVDAARKAAA